MTQDKKKLDYNEMLDAISLMNIHWKFVDTLNYIGKDLRLGKLREYNVVTNELMKNLEILMLDYLKKIKPLVKDYKEQVGFVGLDVESYKNPTTNKLN